MHPMNENIQQVLDFSTHMLFLADKGDLQREDDGCGVLFGIVRDCAYKMKMQAELEIECHRKKGAWDGTE